MTIQVAALCDAATDYHGKLNLLGTFDTILAAQFPVKHSQCAVALRIAFDRIEEGAHKMQLNFVDEDGQSMMERIDLSCDVTFPSDATFISRNFIVNFQQLAFSKAGHYSIDLTVDNQALASIPLCVKQIEKPKT